MEKLNIIPHQHEINRALRNQRNKHESFTIWFTGLSGSGKSTLAGLMEKQLFEQGIQVYILDGDNIRTGLNADLDFTEKGRHENIRRIAEVARLFNDAGVIVLTAFISPYRQDRELAKRVIGPENFIEAWVSCPLEICEQRDVKGLYEKARRGEIKHFTGIDSPFEEPTSPDLILPTHLEDIDHCLQNLTAHINPRMNKK